ncbi:hypothetical protein Ae201684P_003542 [Aphanomyces euteiches]|nr:hypothetical protein Ae201684P_003542 [Aphanomyces euteiches]
MAPEVIQSQYYTTSSDIYSFGVLLSEFSTHQLPYQDMKNPSSGLPMGDTSIMVKCVPIESSTEAEEAMNPTYHRVKEYEVRDY